MPERACSSERAFTFPDNLLPGRSPLRALGARPDRGRIPGRDTGVPWRAGQRQQERKRFPAQKTPGPCAERHEPPVLQRAGHHINLAARLFRRPGTAQVPYRSRQVGPRFKRISGCPHGPVRTRFEGIGPEPLPVMAV